MPIALRRNLSQGELCLWCLDDAIIYLTGDRLAGCAWCEAGHRYHQKFGGPWNYKLDEIASEIFQEYEPQLTVEERKAWHKVQEAQRMAKDRGDQLALGTWTKSAKVESDGTGQAPTPNSYREED